MIHISGVTIIKPIGIRIIMRLSLGYYMVLNVTLMLLLLILLILVVINCYYCLESVWNACFVLSKSYLMGTLRIVLRVLLRLKIVCICSYVLGSIIYCNKMLYLNVG
jgi:hypothetical protein